MFKKQLYEKISIEGNCPEYAVNRLQRSGICLYRVKKIKKNRIIATVTKKDSEKVFAIYPNMCYNRGERKAYLVTKKGKTGLYRLLSACKNRLGALVGAAAFLTLTSFSEFFVLGILVTGEPSYAREAEEILSSFGVERFKAYPKGREEKIATALLSIEGVTFASVKKSGVMVRVELRLSPFSSSEQNGKDMVAKHSGVLLSAVVLRGTLLKEIGKSVSIGEAVVGGYILTDGGKRAETVPSAKIVIACTAENFYEAETEEEAVKKATLAVDGEIVSLSAKREENGYIVRILYHVTESVNF